MSNTHTKPMANPYPEGFSVACRGLHFYNVKLSTMECIADHTGQPAKYGWPEVAMNLAENDLAAYGLVPWVQIPVIGTKEHTGSIMHPVRKAT